MENLKYCVGIDVSKNDIHCCISGIDVTQQVKVRASHKFVNGKVGFSQLCQWVGRNLEKGLPVTFVMEATGVYHEQLAWFLHLRGESVSILLPNRARKYLQAQGTKSKNGKIDARGLAQLGAEKKLDTWVPASPELLTLRSYTRQHQSLGETLCMLKSQLHSIQHSHLQVGEVVRQLEESIGVVSGHIQEMEKAMEKLIKADPVLHKQYKNITGIKGMGLMAFSVIVAETNGFALFENARRLVSYAGYDVVENQSGAHVGRTRISKKGNPRIRRVMLMPAFCAVREDQPQFKNLYERVYGRTKIKMKAYVAVQKKLLVMAYHLWKKGEEYKPNFIHPREKNSPEEIWATHDESQKETLK